MQCAQRGTNAECSVPYGAQILNAEFEMLNEKKKEKVGMEKRNLRSTHRRGSYAKAPAPQSEFASLSIQHSAFSIGATAPRVPHSALAQQAALTPAPQSNHSAFSISHSAFAPAELPRQQARNAIAEKSFNFAVSIYSLAKKLRQAHSEFDLSKQLLRSGTSIGANVAEGVRAQSKADFISKMAIALKEANETDFWLRLLHKVGLIDESEFTGYRKEVNELIALLTSITKSAARS